MFHAVICKIMIDNWTFPIWYLWDNQWCAKAENWLLDFKEFCQPVVKLLFNIKIYKQYYANYISNKSNVFSEHSTYFNILYHSLCSSSYLCLFYLFVGDNIGWYVHVYLLQFGLGKLKTVARVLLHRCWQMQQNRAFFPSSPPLFFWRAKNMPKC